MYGREIFILYHHATHTYLVQRYVPSIWRFSLWYPRDCLARYINCMLGLHHLGNVTATIVGMVGLDDLVGLVHVLNNTDFLQIQLPGHFVRADISAKGNRILGGGTSAGVSFFHSGRNAIIHNLGYCHPVKTTFQARYEGLNCQTKKAAAQHRLHLTPQEQRDDVQRLYAWSGKNLQQVRCAF
jgi:hypothetical protein